MPVKSGITVVKIGGSTLGSEDTSLKDISDLQRQGERVVVVHGGGSRVTEWMDKLGIEAKFVDGLRVTDHSSLEVVASVLGGLINAQLVGDFLASGTLAVGLSGVDGRMFSGLADRPELGYVAHQVTADPRLVHTALAAGYLPIIAPLAIDPTSGHLLNVNADTAAGAMAVALEAERLVFLTDVDGLLDSDGKTIRCVPTEGASSVLRPGILSGGMVPKVEASLLAAARGCQCHIVNGTVPAVLRSCLRGDVVGTVIS